MKDKKKWRKKVLAFALAIADFYRQFFRKQRYDARQKIKRKNRKLHQSILFAL